MAADRSTEEHRRLRAKFVGYGWHLQNARFINDRGGRARVNVLFVTSRHQRMCNMMEMLRRMQKPNRVTDGGRGWLRFCVDQELTLEDPRRVFHHV
jgi:hypothetical protein